MSTAIILGIIPADLDNPTPDWTFLGTGAAMDIYNGVAAVVLILAGIAVLVGAALLAYGKIGHNSQSFTAGLWTIGLGAVVGLVVGSAGLIINYGANMDLDKDGNAMVRVLDPGDELIA